MYIRLKPPCRNTYLRVTVTSFSENNNTSLSDFHTCVWLSALNLLVPFENGKMKNFTEHTEQYFQTNSRFLLQWFVVAGRRT